MADSETIQDQIFSKTTSINAPAPKVWAALTQPELMMKWMSETPLEITTDWHTGSPIVITWVMYQKRFEGKGTVLLFEPERRLQYSHLSSISRLADVPESYSIIDFTLAPADNSTTLTLTITNFPTETIYKHLAFYWNVAIELLKKFVEADAG